MYEDRYHVLRDVDGDTVDVDIDLGLGVWLKNERVRIMGIDTPESRTRDKVEKEFGLAAKKRLKELIGGKSGPILRTQIDKSCQDANGLFGRILGDFNDSYRVTDRWEMVSGILVSEGHAVAYFGGSKEEIQEKHMVNRKKLIREGTINMTEEQAGL